MRPIKASFLVLYCLAALTAVGTAVSHLWRTAKEVRDEAGLIATAPPTVPPAPAGAQPS